MAFTGSSRKVRYAGTRLAINATKASVAATAARVSGSDALTPKTNVFHALVKDIESAATARATARAATRSGH